MEPIKDGLKCWLEGSDLTSSSTNWNDRSGNNNNFSITGTPVAQNNMAVFSGDWYAKIDNLNINYGTIELTASFSSDVVNDNIYAYGSWKVNNYKYGLGNYRIVARSKNNNSTTIFNKLLSSDINELRTYGITFNENTCVIYYEGQIIETIKSTNMPNIISFYLGYKSDSNKKGIGNIKSLKIYDRKLEPYEILANYQYELLDRNTNLYVNENNLPKIVDKLSNASNIKITGNKYGNRVQTVVDKIVEKADDVTKAIEQEVINDSYSFKVGTGNVDVSADVKDGFGEVGIKGVTYQNLIIPNSMTKPNNIIIDGDIVTLLDSYNTFEGITYKALTKKNTTYTVVLDVKELFEDGIGYKIQINDGAYLYNEPLKPGINVIKIATKENGDNYHIAILKVSTAVGTMKFSKKILLLEGDYTNDPNLPSYFEGIVGVGDKSKNLLNPNSFKSSTGISMIENQVINIDVPTDGGQRTIFEGLNLPAGTYRVTTKVLEGEYTGGNLLFYDSNGEKFTEKRLIGSYTINATNNNINKLSIWAVKGICKIRIQLEKGSSETPYEPYYDGHKIEILSNGKNLYKPNLHIKSANGLTFSLHGNTLIVNGTCTKIVDFRPINITESIALELYNYVNKLPAGTTLSLSNNLGLKNYFSLKRNGVQTYPANTFIIQEGDYDISCFVRFEEGQSYNNAELNIQLEINNVATEFEPYVSDKTQILLDEPLMRLPNGVCDEITRDGKLIRRVGKIVFTGIESWNLSKTSDKTILFEVGVSNIKIDKRGDILPICDKLLASLQSNIWVNDIEGVSYTDSSNNRFRIRINKNRLDTQDLTGFKKWLSENPTTVYYELAKPIITNLSESQIRMFKDGVIKFDTLVAPESTHYVQLNKSAQIQSAIKESQWLDNKIDSLENGYDTLMLSTMSILDNLELDYTLK